MLLETGKTMWAASMGKILTFFKNALNFLTILQVALKYSNKSRWGGEGRRISPGDVKPTACTCFVNVIHLNPNPETTEQVWFSLGKPWSRSSLSSPV